MPVKEITKTAIICTKCKKEIVSLGVLVKIGHLKIQEYSNDSGHSPKVYIDEFAATEFHYHNDCLNLPDSR